MCESYSAEHSSHTLPHTHTLTHPPTHTVVPESVVIGCQGSDVTGAKPSEIAVRLHFEAEHSNVLIVTAELLNGCLARVEVHRMTMCLVQDGIPHHPVSGRLQCSGCNSNYPVYMQFQDSVMISCVEVESIIILNSTSSNFHINLT